jgi:hypothetical protein
MRYVMSMIGALVLASSSAAMAAPAEATDTAVKAENQQEFHGLNLGVGLSLTLDTGSHDRVNDAEIVAGLVRVKDEENARARIMLESHYFFFPGSENPTPEEWDGSFFGVKRKDWGVGPFVAIQPGEGEIVQAAALGLMVGFRQPEGGRSWNVGVGIVYDPNTKTLGDGLAPNRPLPAGETQIRYKERAQKGVVILTSFSF